MPQTHTENSETGDVRKPKEFKWLLLKPAKSDKFDVRIARAGPPQKVIPLDKIGIPIVGMVPTVPEIEATQAEVKWNDSLAGKPLRDQLDRKSVV